MSSSLVAAENIRSIANTIFLYGTTVVMILGLFGNGLNILIFTTLRIFRQQPCSFCIFVESLSNFGQLVMHLLSYCLLYGWNIDASSNSPIWCKIRSVGQQTFNLIYFGTVCFSAFDQYLATNPRGHWRQLSSLKLIQYFVGSEILFSLVHGIPFLIFFDVDSVQGCIVGNSLLNIYYSFFYYPVLIGLLPMLFTVSFSCFAFYNVRHLIRRQIPIVRRRLDRQLTAMILIQVICFVTFTLPYVVDRIVILTINSNQDNPMFFATIYFLSTIVSLFFSLNYMISFYIFWISSVRFRRQVKFILVKKHWRLIKRLCTKRIRFSHTNRIFPAVPEVPVISNSEFE